MLGLTRPQLLKALVMVVCAVGVIFFAIVSLIPVPPKKITIATGVKGAAFEYYGNRYRDVFARHHVRLEVRHTNGAEENLRLLQDPGSGVDIGFVQGGVSNASKAPNVESMGRVSYFAFFIFCRADEKISDLTQFKGRRIAIGPAASGTHKIAVEVLKANGVTAGNTTFLPLAGQDAVDAMGAGKVDVLFLGSDPETPLIQSLLHDPDLRLISLPRAKALIRKFHFLTRLELPTGMVDFEKNIPDRDTTIIATTSSVLVRADLHPEIIGLLAQTLVEIHGAPGFFQQFGEFPTQTDPEFPMAASAQDFYRNGPAFLQRYLPFWFASYARRIFAILVTLLAITVPVFSYAPKVYLWFLRRRVGKLYRDLRIVQSAMQPGLPASRLLSLQGDLEEIEHACKVLPMRHSDLFFELWTQIDLSRERLRACLDAARARGRGGAMGELALPLPG
jgi:TRAP-type uncharacterized transport system substrate-binding protein